MKVKNNIRLIDANFFGKTKSTCIFLLESVNHIFTLVDTGTPKQFPIIQKELQKFGVNESNLKSILLTHHHIDHSGNLGLFLDNYPKLEIFCHKEVPFLLTESFDVIEEMRRVLGKKFDNEFWYQKPLDFSRFNFIQDKDKLSFGEGINFSVLSTPGHSSDHLSFLYNDIIFGGDAFGNSYDMIQPHIALPSFPSCSKIEDCLRSVSKIVETNAKIAAISHFGFVFDLKKHSNEYYNFAQQIVECIRHDNAKELLFRYYQKIFGEDFQKKYNKIRAHCQMNQTGIDSLFRRLKSQTKK